MDSSVLVVMVVALGVTFISMVLHELMHGLTAYWLGDDTAKVNGRLSLNPIKHIDPYLTIILPGLIIRPTHYWVPTCPYLAGLNRRRLILTRSKVVNGVQPSGDCWTVEQT